MKKNSVPDSRTHSVISGQRQNDRIVYDGDKQIRVPSDEMDQFADNGYDEDQQEILQLQDYAMQQIKSQTHLEPLPTGEELQM